MSGALIMAAGMAAMISIVHRYGAAASSWDLAPALAVGGLGLGSVIMLARPARRGHKPRSVSV